MNSNINIEEKNTNKIDNDFEKRMRVILEEEFDSFEKALELPRITALRINPLKKRNNNEKSTDFSVAFTDSQQSIPWEQYGHIYNDGTPGKHPYHEAGVYYIQEPSAMAPVHYLDPQPGEKILDLCAAPGGKSTQIASYMNGEGILVTNEIDKKRAQILSLNIERCGVRNAIVTSMDPARLSEIFEGYFDKILVDAPCSGEGMFRKNDEAISNWSIENVKMCSARQKTILGEAVKMLAPGGRLVYSTCTFAPEEDEESALYLIKEKELKPVKAEHFDGMKSADVAYLKRLSAIDESLKEISKELSPDDSEAASKIAECGIRLWPHHIDGEGHFLAVFEKDGNIDLNKGMYGVNGSQKYAVDKDVKLFSDFAAENLKGIVVEKSDKIKKAYVVRGFLNGVIISFGEQLYLSPEKGPGLNGMTVLRPGLHLGTVKKERFEPSHALALAIGTDDVNFSYDIDSGSQEAMQFIGGQSLRVSGFQNGWYLITTDGYSLGWAKYAGGTLKNHYPKGLRIYT